MQFLNIETIYKLMTKEVKFKYFTADLTQLFFAVRHL